MMKKCISLLLALLLTFSCLSLPASALAAGADGCLKIKLSGTQYDSVVFSVLKEINTKRRADGMAGLKLDTSLSNIAQKRAAEVMLYATYRAEDNSFSDTYRPDGSKVNAMLPADFKGAYHSYSACSFAGTEAVSDVVDLLSGQSLSDIKSLGLAIFGYKNVFSVYFIVSEHDILTKYTNRTDTHYTYLARLHPKFIEANVIYGNFKKATYTYALKTEVYAGGIYDEYFPVNNNQLTYTSSNPAVLKIIGTTAYPKQNGKCKIVVKSKAGKTVAWKTGTYRFFNGLTVEVKSVKSNKKKTFTAQWKRNIKDADGYQVQYSADKHFKKGVKTATVQGNKATARTVRKLTSGRRYYVRVRAYIYQGGKEKAFSPWSKKQKVKVL